MLQKFLLILSAALFLSGNCMLVGTLHISTPEYVYATSEDAEDYDYLEIYDNTEDEEATTETSSATDTTATEPPAPSTTGTSDKPHILDSTPKTADFNFSPQFALSLGIFFLGLSIFFLAQRKKK